LLRRLFGVGGVGAALLRTVLGSRDAHLRIHGLRFQPVGITDSSAALVGSSITDETLHSMLAHKEGGGRLSDFQPTSGAIVPAGGESADFLKSIVKRCAEEASEGCMVVDCTATATTVPALLLAANTPNMQLVSANKKPFSSELAVFDQLAGGPWAAGKARFESVVGAGLPVIAAAQRLRAAADPVARIGGALSGTLGYVMSGLQAGEPFSQVVTKAKELGYTEPDPRDDLGGVDVARKALILARLAGLRLEMSDVAVEPLFSAEMAEVPVGAASNPPRTFPSSRRRWRTCRWWLSRTLTSSLPPHALQVPDFMARLPELDAGFAAKVSNAAAAGKVLRYVGSVVVDASLPGGGKLVVGLQEVDASSPLGTLSGSDNLVEFYTGWYPESPLVLRGAGAGTGTTAAGVLADMVELAFTRTA
jgi:homoserine dehydrogenase